MKTVHPETQKCRQFQEEYVLMGSPLTAHAVTLPWRCASFLPKMFCAGDGDNYLRGVH